MANSACPAENQQPKSIPRSSFATVPLRLDSSWVVCSGYTPETQQAPLLCLQGEENLRPTLQPEKWGHEEVKEHKEVSTRSCSNLHGRREQSCNRLTIIFRFVAKTVWKAKCLFLPGHYVTCRGKTSHDRGMKVITSREIGEVCSWQWYKFFSIIAQISLYHTKSCCSPGVQG